MSVEVTPALLAELRKKAEAATPGLWKWEDHGTAYAVSGPLRKNRYEDSQFTATANPAVVLALVAEVERLRDDLVVQCPRCGQILEIDMEGV